MIAQADAPASAVVLAWPTGSTETRGADAVDDRREFRLEVSFDAGTTWATQASSRRWPRPPRAVGHPPTAVNGSLSGDMQVRIMCRDIDTADFTLFANGVITRRSSTPHNRPPTHQRFTPSAGVFST